MSMHNSNVKKKNQPSLTRPHLLCNGNGGKVVVWAGRLSPPRHVWSTSQGPQTLRYHLKEVRVLVVEFTQHQAPLRGSFFRAIKQPIGQRLPSLWAVQLIVIHLFCHIVHTPSEGTPVGPNVPARTQRYESHIWQSYVSRIYKSHICVAYMSRIYDTHKSVA